MFSIKKHKQSNGHENHK